MMTIEDRVPRAELLTELRTGPSTYLNPTIASQGKQRGKFVPPRR